MDDATSSDAVVSPALESVDHAQVNRNIFPFLQLPRELRDQIYDCAFDLPESRSRIERRHLKYFTPSAATILLLLRHEYFLLNRQVAREALDVLVKNHTVFLSCGPYILKLWLTKIEESGAPGKTLLKRIKRIELDWVTFPNLKIYPPEKSEGKEWWYENDSYEVDVDYIRGTQYSGHYDEHDYEGGYYDDNFYDPEDESLYPSFPQRNALPAPSSDPFGFSTHYPFAHPTREPDDDVSSTHDISSKLDLLITMEVTPLFEYLSTSTFALSSMTVPLYFISKPSYHHRHASRPGYALPLKLRYWVYVCIHALLMLRKSATLQEVHVKYMPWDIWASMEPADDLQRMVDKGVFFKGSEADEREGEGEAFRAVWQGLKEKGVCKRDERLGLDAEVKFVKWEGGFEDCVGDRVGDSLEVVFRKGKSGGE